MNSCLCCHCCVCCRDCCIPGALDQKQQTALNNLQAEVLRCSSFHLISQMGFEQSE